MAPQSLVVVLLLVLPSLWSQVRVPVPVVWMVPDGSVPGQDRTAALLPALTLALEDVKEQPGLLRNHALQLLRVDTKCDVSWTLKSLFELMWAGPGPLIILGGACPSVTSLLSPALPALQMVQVSFLTPPPPLSHRKWFGHMVSTVPSDWALNRALVKLLQTLEWTRVGLVSERTLGISQILRDLLLQLDHAQVQVLFSVRFSDDACSALQQLKDKDIRIFIALFEEDSASELFCCAYRLNLFGPRIQWLLLGARGDWTLGWTQSHCSTQSLLIAAEGSIRIQVQSLRPNQGPGVSGRTAEEYEQLYLSRLSPSGLKVAPLHGFVYDSVWLMALALNRVLEEPDVPQENRNMNATQEDRTPDSPQAPDLNPDTLLQAVKATHFTGVTGPVKFLGAERVATLELIQLQGSSSVLVGEFLTSHGNLTLNPHLLKFKGSRPPRDRTLVSSQPRHVTLTLYVVMATASSVVVVLSVSILCLCLIARARRRVLWRCVSQEEVLCVGVLLCCASVLVSGLDQVSVPGQTRTTLCSVQVWVLSVGHSLLFSVFFTEAWILYSITQSLPKSHLQKPGRLLLWLLVLDVFVLSSWTALDPLRWVETVEPPQPDPSDEDVFVQWVTPLCHCGYSDLWLTALCGYKGPLLGLGLFVAWSLGPSAGLVGVCLKSGLSALSLFSALGVLSYISHDALLRFSLSSGFVLSACLTALASAFGPKMFAERSEDSDLRRRPSPTRDEEEEEQWRKSLNRQLRTKSLHLGLEIDHLRRELFITASPHAAVREVKGRPVCTHEAQVYTETRAAEEDPINNPERVFRRVSLQLPILHHSYLPVVGGVSPSSTQSSLH